MLPLFFPRGEKGKSGSTPLKSNERDKTFLAVPHETSAAHVFFFPSFCAPFATVAHNCTQPFSPFLRFSFGHRKPATAFVEHRRDIRTAGESIHLLRGSAAEKREWWRMLYERSQRERLKERFMPSPLYWRERMCCILPFPFLPFDLFLHLSEMCDRGNKNLWSFFFFFFSSSPPFSPLQTVKKGQRKVRRHPSCLFSSPPPFFFIAPPLLILVGVGKRAEILNLSL